MTANINQSLEKLRQLTQIDVQNNWRFYPQDLPLSEVEFQQWQQASLNEKGHICWSEGSKVRWFTQKIIVPSHLNHYSLVGCSLRLVLSWWAESAQIYVNGTLVQEGDLFDGHVRLLLTKEAIANQEIIVALRLVSPSHDQGALTQAKCIYEKPLDPGFIADELTVLHNYLATFALEKIEQLDRIINQINWEQISDTTAFDLSLLALRQQLQPLALDLKKRSIYLLGHAHLDLAWLWTVAETWKVAEKTFTSVLSLQKDFPQLTFSHSTSALYAWLETNRPHLFEAIQKQVSQGKWEIVGGMWVECDANLVSGESFVRQLLYGQNYLQAKFGSKARIAWLPDTFGFSWQLPQIFSQAGIEYFVTTKLHWNDTTKFPYGCFWWGAPDGSELLTLLCCPLGMDTNPLKMSDYAIAWETQTQIKHSFWLTGVGDHGGGPSRDMLEVAQLWEQSPFFPRVQYTSADEYLRLLEMQSLPCWDDELYLEFHRGCYTTHSKQKKYNRHTEGLLYGAELFSTIALLLQKQGFPLELEMNTIKTKIEQAWKKVLFNQFHDILPGTSIAEVFTEATQQWLEAIALAEQVLQQSLNAITSLINYPPPPHPKAKPLVVFNSLNWQRSEVVSVGITDDDWFIYNHLGHEIPSQRTQEKILFLGDIPSIGYKVYWLVPGNRLLETPATPEEFILENDFVVVRIDPVTGDIASIVDKKNQQEILNGVGNQLQGFVDQGQYWDAWNIDPNYFNHPLPPTQLKSIQWRENGPIQWCVRVVRELGRSQFTQDYILSVNSPVLKITTEVDWQENHVLVKAAFPLNLESDYVTYEIACGAIERSTRQETQTSKAKWEVPALNWADLSDVNQGYGVSLLNDCKYGYDSQPSQLRLSLLRSSSWPDPEADRGTHQFTYAIYPHSGDWKSAKTVNKGYELNKPLLVSYGAQENCFREITPNHVLPPGAEFLSLNPDNLILMALKPGEKQGWFLRCYEAHGENVTLSLGGDLGIAVSPKGNTFRIAYPVDLLEAQTTEVDFFQIQPWKIRTFKLELMENGD